MKATPHVRFPSVMVVSPRFAAHVHKVLLVLFCLFALVPGCFLVDVVHVVLIDLADSAHCMLVDQFVVLIKCFLPFL